MIADYRTMLKALVPPLIVEALRGSPLYPSWEATCRAANAYTDEKLNRFKIERSALRVRGSSLNGNALYLTALSAGNPALSIVDFGGSTGDLGDDILSALPEATYTVVENPTMVAMMLAKGGKLKYATTVPSACDIFLTSSTLQYIDDPQAALDAGFASAGYAVILARNSFCDRQLFRVQKHRLFNNGSGTVPPGYENDWVSYPHRTIREVTVMECAKAHGFECVARLEESSGILPYRGIVYGRQLVFMRKEAKTSASAWPRCGNGAAR